MHIGNSIYHEKIKQTVTVVNTSSMARCWAKSRSSAVCGAVAQANWETLVDG